MDARGVHRRCWYGTRRIRETECPGWHACVTGVMELKASGRNVEVGAFNAVRSLDGDAGLSWGDPMLVYEPPQFGYHAGAPQVATGRVGVVYVSFMTDYNEEVAARTVRASSWPDGAWIKVLASKSPLPFNDGWQLQPSISSPNSYWAQVFSEDGDGVYVTYNRGANAHVTTVAL